MRNRLSGPHIGLENSLSVLVSDGEFRNRDGAAKQWRGKRGGFGSQDLLRDLPQADLARDGP